MSVEAFEHFREAFVAGDADRLAEAFTPDGAYATNVGILLQGRDQIRTGAAQWFGNRPPGAVVELDVRVLRSNESDTIRWELLDYRQHSYVPGLPDAGSLDESGYALAVYPQDGAGTRRIESLVVNLRFPIPR